MIIETIDELKQRIGKFVIIYCNSGAASMRILTKVDEECRRQFYGESYKSQIYGCYICGKLSAQMHPFIPYLGTAITYLGGYMHIKDPTQQEIKEFMQNWRKYIYNTKIKPK